MKELVWTITKDPIRMLELLGENASKRKLRLFIAHGVTVIGTLFGENKELAELHERVAEGLATEEDLERFLLRDMQFLWDHRAPGGNLPSVGQTARLVVRERFKLAPLEKSQAITVESRAAEYSEMCSVLRCIFGNLFHSNIVDPVLLSWNGGTALHLAQAIYDERAYERLPILADALEEAGCTDAAILDHCRGPGPHVRGCWVVDLLLGKE
jgi:hypothetical protein